MNRPCRQCAFCAYLMTIYCCRSGAVLCAGVVLFGEKPLAAVRRTNSSPVVESAAAAAAGRGTWYRERAHDRRALLSSLCDSRLLSLLVLMLSKQAWALRGFETHVSFRTVILVSAFVLVILEFEVHNKHDEIKV